MGLEVCFVVPFVGSLLLVFTCYMHGLCWTSGLCLEIGLYFWDGHMSWAVQHGRGGQSGMKFSMCSVILFPQLHALLACTGVNSLCIWFYAQFWLGLVKDI